MTEKIKLEKNVNKDNIASPEISIEELVVKAKTDRQALSQLYDQMQRSIYSICSKYTCNGYEQEDFTQECANILQDIVMSFDETKNIKFNTYMTNCMKNLLNDIIKSANAKKRKSDNNLSLDAPIITGEDGEENETLIDRIPSGQLSPEDIVIKDEEAKFVNETISQCLDEIEQQIVELWKLKMSYEEIAEKISHSTGKSYSAKTIDNKFQQIKKKLRKYINDKNN